jgi:uroporphyrinogen-III decarboxylase
VPLPIQGDRYELGFYVDEWGCRFENIQKGIIGEVRTPLLTSWDRLDAVRIPHERLSVDVERVNDFCRQTDRFVLSGCVPRPFERLQFLRGSAALLTDLVRRPPELLTLLQRLHEFYLKELELWASTAVDGLMFMDDWGSQHSMLVSPAMWRALFKPIYADYIRLAHDHGKYIFMHSDGYILDILPDLIELGLDAINSQVACMGIRAVGQQCAGRITFWGEIDRQQLLPHGSRADVIETVRQMHAALYRDGGVIAQCEFGPGANPDNVLAVFEAWDRF